MSLNPFCFLPCVFSTMLFFRHTVPPISLGYSFMWLTESTEPVNCRHIWFGTSWGIWHHRVGHWLYFQFASGPSCYIFTSVPGVSLPKVVGDLKVYFFLLAASVNWIIKVLPSLFETPKRKDFTRANLGIQRKWDKECNHNSSEWFSDWHLYIKNM